MTRRLSFRRRRNWAESLDFAGPRVRTAPWAWGLMLAGLVSAAWVWPMVMQVDADMAEAQDTVKRLARAAHQRAVAAKVPTHLVAGKQAVPGLTPEAAHHAAQLAQWLAYPWLDVLDQVESAALAEQVVMLSFSLNLSALGSSPDSQPDVRVAAAVRDDASALRWAHAQGPSAQLLSRERLGTSFVAAAGQYDWRAEVTWAGGTP